MDVRAGVAAGTESPFVSTGRLPGEELVQGLVVEAHERYRTNDDGALSQVYPALERVPRGLFGICVADIGGDAHAAGDVEAELTIMSVAKPFLYALVCEQLGRDEVRRLVGVNATGLPFNSLEAVERSGDGRTNPMVNPGAIAVTSLVPGRNAEERWRFILEGLSGFAGREPRARRRGLPLGERDQPPQPEPGPAAAELRAAVRRPGRGGRPLHAPVLPAGDSARPCGDGRDARQRRRQSAHARVGRRSGELSLHARRDGDRRACTRRPATGSTTSASRARAASAAASSPSPPARAGWAPSRRCWTRPATASRGSWPPPSCLAGSASTSSPRSMRESCSARRARGARAAGDRARRPGAGDGARPEIRPGRAARRGHRLRAGRSVRPDLRRPAVPRADGGAARSVAERRRGQDRPERGGSLARPLPVPPRLPRQRARPGVRLPPLAAAADGRPRARGLRARRHRSRSPGQAGAPVLAVLRLQRLEQPARGRLGDDPARLRRLDPCAGAPAGAGRGRLQPARGRRAGGVGRRQARARRRHAPGRAPGLRLARELLRRGALPRAARRSRASAATTRAGRRSTCARS